MPRPKRYDWPGARHHVMNRGARRAPIFLDAHLCGSFVKLLSELPERFGLVVHGFALMPNHFHLMLESQRGELSRGMAFVQARYSLLVNRRKDWDGPLFRARFRSKVVRRPEHWRHLLAYLHLNPLRAHLIMSLDQSIWTSHPAYLGEAPHLDWVRTRELLKAFGGVDGYQAYLRACMRKKGNTPEAFERAALFQRGRHADQLQTAETDPAGGGEAATTLEESLALAAHRLGEEIPDLVESRDGRAADPRRQVLVWWLVQRQGLQVKEVARALQLSRGRVSQLVRLGQERRSAARLRHTVEALCGRQP